MAFCQNEQDIVRTVASDQVIESLSEHSHLQMRVACYSEGPPICYARPPFMEFKREVTLPSGRRMDMLGIARNNRAFWIIEFKTHADTSALVQIMRYAEELQSHWQWKQRKKIFGIQCSIIAKTFDADCLYLAKRLEIQVLQFIEVTRRYCRLEAVISPARLPRDLVRRGNKRVKYHDMIGATDG